MRSYQITSIKVHQFTQSPQQRPSPISYITTPNSYLHPRPLKMQFKYSSILELTESETQNFNLGIPIRVHNNRELEDYGCIRAQHDWSNTIAPLGFYKGGLTSRLGFLSAVVPECLPDRLEFLAYVNEFEFIYDDMTDKLEDCQVCVFFSSLFSLLPFFFPPARMIWALSSWVVY
jgi:hypothetical protein